MPAMSWYGCRSPIKRVFLLLIFLETLCTRVGNSHGSNQAFIQTDSELRYLAEEVSSFNEDLAKEPTGYSEHPPGISVLGSPIKFEPPELDFNEHPTGQPVLRKIRVTNLNSESSIQMLSISGNTIHFHCSFFADKVIPPSGNTSFDIVFLGREEGVVENTLYIHTSAGSFRFKVRAVGIPSPYRIKALVGVKMPVNSSYSPLIQLHNPHSEPIQVLEIYSSGGDLHLELPSGETEGPRALWQIPPYQTKSVMKANFVARVENNHTAYIRIKTNTTGAYLYLPMEVEVSSQPGIYCPQELLDFGILASTSEPKTMKLHVLNSGQKSIQIQNVISTTACDGLTVKFEPVKIPPDTLKPTVVADVIFDPSLVKKDGLCNGKLVIKSKNSQFKVTIPYRARVLSGKIFVNESISKFHLHSETYGEAPDDVRSRNLTIKNEFSVPIVVHNITLAPPAARFFSLTPFKPVVLTPGETRDLVILTLKPEAWIYRVLDSHLMLHTNVSNMNIPLICYHGMVETFFPSSPSQETLDFGTLGMNEKREQFIMIVNKNPVAVKLTTWGCNTTCSSLELIGVEPGDQGNILQRANFSNMERKLDIPPGNYMVFRIVLNTPNVEVDKNGTMFINTDFHSYLIPMKYRIAKGSLQTVPRELIFDPAFPGITVRLKLKLYSSFSDNMTTDRVYTIPRDPRFSFRKSSKSNNTLIRNAERVYVGKLSFDPGATCQLDESCYSGFTLTSKIGREWFSGINLDSNAGEIDVGVIHTLWNRFLAATIPSPTFNISLNLDTNKVRGFLFKANARLVWPTVTTRDRIVFPLTQVGSNSTGEVVLTNPSQFDVWIQIVPMASYPSGGKVAALLPSRIKTLNLDKENLPFPDQLENVFRIASVFDLSGSHPVLGIGDILDVRLPPESKVFVLSAGRSVRVSVKFKPDSVGKFHQGIFIRNNLTGIDFVELKAESVQGEIKFGKWKSSQSGIGVLDFEMSENLLKECSNPKESRYSVPVLSVKRKFKLKNTGLTPVFISGYEIEGQPCENHGFKVLNCDPIILEPGEQIDVDIAFSPDFTLSKVSRVLTILTTLSPKKSHLQFNLLATIPTSMLPKCAALLPGPGWEANLRYFTNILLIVIFILILGVAFIDADRIVRMTIGIHFQTRAHLLDLRKVAEQARNELNQGLNNGVLNNERQAGVNPNKTIVKKPRLLSRLSSKFFQLLTLPYNWAVSLQKKTLARFKQKQEPSRLRRNQHNELDDAFGFSESNLDDDESDAYDDAEYDDLEEEEEEIVVTREHREPEAVESESPRTSNSSRRNRNRKRGQQNKQQKQSVVGEFYARNRISDDMDSSSTCTESSAIDDELSFVETINSSKNKAKIHQLKNRATGSPKRQNVTATHSSMNNNINNYSNNNTKANQPNIKNSKQGKKSTPLANVAKQAEVTQPKQSKASNNDVQAVRNSDAVLKRPSTPTSQTPSLIQTDQSKKVATPRQASSKELNSPKEEVANKRVTAEPVVKCAPSKTPPLTPVATTSQSPQASAPTPAAASGSSIFSSSGFGSPLAPLSTSDSQKQRAKVTPVGKILPEIKKPENFGAQYGPIGAKPPNMIPVNEPAKKSPWMDPEPKLAPTPRNDDSVFRTSSADSVAHLNDMDYAARLAQQQHQPNGMFSNQHRLLEDPSMGQNLPDPILGLRRAAHPSLSPRHTSLMQTLQLERRQRTEEYFAQHPQHDWPGFGPQSVSMTDCYIDNLWDPPSESNDASRAVQQSSAWDVWPTWSEARNDSIVPSPIIDSLPALNSRPGTGASVPPHPNETNDGRTFPEYRSLMSLWNGVAPNFPGQGGQSEPQQRSPSSSWSATLFSDNNTNK